MRGVLLALTACFIAACGGPEGPQALPQLTWGPSSNTLFRPPSDASGIAGDWFRCRDRACSELDDDGIRLTADGRIIELEAPGGRLEPNEQYCANGLVATYSYAAGQLTLTSAERGGETLTATFVVEGDRAILSNVFSSEANVYMRIRPTREDPFCRDEARNIPIGAPPPRTTSPVPPGG